MTKAKISNEFYKKLKTHKGLLQVNSYFSSQPGRRWKKGLKGIFISTAGLLTKGRNYSSQ